MNKKAYVLLAPGYEEIEALTPVDFLRRAGVEVKIVSTIDEMVVKSAHEVSVQADVSLKDITDTPNALIIPGGLPGAPNLAENDEVLALVKKTAAAGGFLCAICAGPMVLDKVGLLEGKTITCYPGFEDHLKSYKTYLSTPLVSRDDAIITGCGPAASPYFAIAIIEALLGADKAQEIREQVLLPRLEAAVAD